MILNYLKEWLYYYAYKRNSKNEIKNQAEEIVFNELIYIRRDTNEKNII